jgi:hypothetical protein
MRFVLILLILTFATNAYAGRKFGEGVAADVALGAGSAMIKNPDDSKAHYKVLAVHAKGLIPVFETEDFSGYLTGNVRYLDLENSGNSSAQSEVATMLGPGAGIHLRLYKFTLGADYNYMIARHYAVGAISRQSEYEIPVTNVYAGLSIPFKQLAVSLSYNMASGTVPKDSSALSKDCPYTDQIYMIQFTYSTDQSFGKFLDFLF